MENEYAELGTQDVSAETLAEVRKLNKNITGYTSCILTIGIVLVILLAFIHGRLLFHTD